MSSTVTCVAKFTAKPNCSKELKEALRGLIEPTRKEAGCISYNMYEALDNGSVITMIEEFADSAALEFHSGQAYLVDFKKDAAEFFESVSIDLYKSAS